MALTSIWQEVELSFHRVWDWAQAEARVNPLIPILWIAMAYVLWRIMRPKN
jgi:hypothetical protein